MAVGFVNSARAQASAATSHPITVPTGVTAGHLIVLIASKTTTSGSWSSLTGWTREREFSNATAGIETAVFYKIATSSEDAGDTVTVATSASASSDVVPLAFSGIHGASPQVMPMVSGDDGSSVTSHIVDASSINPPGNAAVVYAYVHAGGAATSYSPPTGYTEILDGYVTLGYEVAWAAVGAGSLGSLTGTSGSAKFALKLAIAFSEAVTSSVAPGSTNSATGTSGSVTGLSLPGSTGDLLILQVSTSGTTTPSPPTGWSTIHRGSFGATMTQSAFYRVKQAGDTTVDVTASNHVIASCTAFSGHDPEFPIATSNFAYNGSVSSVTPPRLHIARDGALHVMAYGTDPTAAETFNTPVGYTELYDYGQAASEFMQHALAYVPALRSTRGTDWRGAAITPGSGTSNVIVPITFAINAAPATTPVGLRLATQSQERATSVTSLALNTPAGAAVGDLLVMAVSKDGSGSFGAITGSTWTGTGSEAVAPPSGAAVRTALWTRVVDGTETATHTVNWSGLAEAVGEIVCVKGVDQASDPVDGSGSFGASTSSNTLFIPVPALSHPNTLVLCFAGINGQGDDDALTAPASMVKFGDSYEDAGDVRQVAASELVAAGAASSSRAFTSSLSTTMSGFSIAIRGVQPQSLQLPAIASAETVGTPTVTPGAITLHPSGIASAEALGSPFVNVTAVQPAAIGSAEAFGTPVLKVRATAVGIASSEAVGTPTVTSAKTLQPPSIASAAAFGTPEVANLASVDGIDSAEEFGSPTVNQAVHPFAVASAAAFGTLRIRRPADLVAPRNVLIDGTYEYAWAINHSAEDTMTLGRRLTRDAPSAQVGVVRQQDAANPLLLRLQATLLDPAQLAELEDFYDRCDDHAVVFRHAEGDEYDVLLTGLDARHEKVGLNPQFPDLTHIWRVTLEMLVLHVRAGNLGVVA